MSAPDTTIKVKPSELRDWDRLVAVRTKSGSELRIWDETFGPLWVYRESLGPWVYPQGVVRAQTWEEGYECVVDEIMDDAPPFEEWDEEEQQKAESTGELPEGYHHRGGTPSNPKLTSSIAAEDLGYSAMDRLTDELAVELELTIEVEREPEEA